MCGITGIISKNNKPVDKEILFKMNNLIIHRGPDGEGLYIDNDVGLAHRRLSIIDLSKNASQPMQLNNNYTITYNGEIYNYIEIKDELLEKGYTFNSESDTEVVLKAYQEWGQECTEKFNGMWSFAIHDKIKNIIFCSRDRFGIKPFYYYNDKNNFYFGSEIKQLLSIKDSPNVNWNVLMNYLTIGFSDYSKETFFKDIFSLLGGHNLIYDLESKSYNITQFYDLNINNNYLSMDLDEISSEYESILENSVELRLRSDVKIGTCLSGGLDSSTIASIASKKSQDNFESITASSLDRDNNELEYAKTVASSSGINLNIVEPDNTDFVNSINDIVYALDEPHSSISALMQYSVFQKAKEIGCKVMLDGQGGDETLLGYERYYPAIILGQSIFNIPRTFMDTIKNSKLTFIDLIKYKFYFSNYNIRRLYILKKYKNINKKYLDYIEWPLLKKWSQSYLNIHSLQKNELLSYQLPHLLRYEDRLSMTHSVESRLPLIDYRLVELVYSINSKYKVNNGYTKYLNRKYIENFLPKEIAWRKNKVGFEGPSSLLYEKNKDELFKIINESKLLGLIFSNFNNMSESLVWKLFFIAKWEQIHNVKP